jgi:hypothetical protein
MHLRGQIKSRSHPIRARDGRKPSRWEGRAMGSRRGLRDRRGNVFHLIVEDVICILVCEMSYVEIMDVVMSKRLGNSARQTQLLNGPSLHVYALKNRPLLSLLTGLYTIFRIILFKFRGTRGTIQPCCSPTAITFSCVASVLIKAVRKLFYPMSKFYCTIENL